MNGAGFDWLNIAGLSSDSNLPPPPVSFGVTPTSSTDSVDLTSGNGKQELGQQQNPSPQETQPSQQPPIASRSIKSQSEDNLGVQPVYNEAEDDLSVPLSLTVNQLTKDEAKTYLRWYNDIVVRKNTKLIRLNDVFNFLQNFHITDQVRNILERIFRSCSSLNIGEFFALLRLISHSILSQSIPSRRLIKTPAPIPKPRSILSRKRMNDHDDNDDNDSNNEQSSQQHTHSNGPEMDSSKFDLDSFTQFILTGERPGEEPKTKKKNAKKRVKFSDEVSVEPSAEAAEPVNLDLTLPMDQLLGRFPKPQPQPEKNVNEEEELKEMQGSFDRFKNIKNVDSALIHGTPANIPSIFFDNEMQANASNTNSPRVSSPDPSSNQPRLLSPNHTGPVHNLSPLPPNHTGPMGSMNSNYLQPTSTGGDMFLNSLLSPNQEQSHSPSNGYLSPNYTGGVEQMNNQNNSNNNAPLQPTMTGSLSSTMRNTFGNQRVGSASPLMGSGNNNLSVPIPPQSRQRSVSSPIPFDQTTLHVPSQQPQQAQQRVPSPISASRSPPPPPPPRSRASTISQAPPPPPSRNSQAPPALPPKIPVQSSSSSFQQQQQPQNYPYSHHNESSSSSTADILGNLKALQSEVDRLQYYQR